MMRCVFGWKVEDSQILLLDLEKYDSEVGLLLKAAEKTENWKLNEYMMCDMSVDATWIELMVQ